jgi:hypothetical protein
MIPFDTAELEEGFCPAASAHGPLTGSSRKPGHDGSTQLLPIRIPTPNTSAPPNAT